MTGAAMARQRDIEARNLSREVAGSLHEQKMVLVALEG